MLQKQIGQREEQQFSVSMGNTTFQLRLYAFRDLMYMDLLQGGEYVFAGKRVMANQWILPSYLAEDRGNLRFETYKADDKDYVWYKEFNTKFRLMIYTASEFKEVESSSAA